MESNKKIAITGVASIVHCNDIEAVYFEQGRHLILWNNDTDKGIWIDKYDARSHFSSCHEFEHIVPTISAEDVIDGIDVTRKLQKELDLERYKDLEDNPEINRFHSEGTYESENDSNGIYRSDAGAQFAYRYSDADVVTTTVTFEADTTVQEPLTLPVALPEGISLPRTKKELDVMLHTALKTRKSAQLEIFLKLKESHNPLFRFLNAESPDNALYMV